jgi:hypothetical protein
LRSLFEPGRLRLVKFCNHLLFVPAQIQSQNAIISEIEQRAAGEEMQSPLNQRRCDHVLQQKIMQSFLV